MTEIFNNLDSKSSKPKSESEQDVFNKLIEIFKCFVLTYASSNIEIESKELKAFAAFFTAEDNDKERIDFLNRLENLSLRELRLLIARAMIGESFAKRKTSNKKAKILLVCFAACDGIIDDLYNKDVPSDIELFNYLVKMLDEGLENIFNNNEIERRKQNRQRISEKSTVEDIFEAVMDGDLIELEYFSERYQTRVTRLFIVEVFPDNILLENKQATFILNKKGQFINPIDIGLKPRISRFIKKEKLDDISYKK